MKGAGLETEKVLSEAKRRGAKDAEVIASYSKGVSISSESGILSEVSESEHFGFGVRVIRNGRVGFSFGNSPEKFREVVGRAIANSKFGGELKSLPPRGGVPRKIPGLYDGKIAEISGKEIIERVGLLIDSAKGTGARPTYAGVSAGIERAIIANSNGMFLEEEGSSVSAGSYSSAGTSTGFESKSLTQDKIDYSEIGRVSGERAVLGKNQRGFGAKKGAEIFLHPYAVEGILSGALIPSVDGENVFRKNSAFSGRLGEKMFSEGFSLEDNGTLPGEIGSAAFDSEGTQSQRTVLFDKGALKGFLYNWETAIKAKAKSTGNAARGYSSLPKIGPSNLVVSPGKGKKNSLEGEADLKVLWFSGTHTINPFSGEFSVEAKGVFSGKGTALKSGIVAGNIFSILKEIEFSKDGIERAGGMIVPPALIKADFVS